MGLTPVDLAVLTICYALKRLTRCTPPDDPKVTPRGPGADAPLDTAQTIEPTPGVVLRRVAKEEAMAA
jgi:hypothetical protein